MGGAAAKCARREFALGRAVGARASHLVLQERAVHALGLVPGLPQLGLR